MLGSLFSIKKVKEGIAILKIHGEKNGESKDGHYYHNN
jgi:hypothetical protein